MNRRDLLRAAKKAGYAGASDLAELKKWAEAEGVEFDLKGKKIEEVWATTLALVVDEPDAKDADEPAAKRGRGDPGKVGAVNASLADIDDPSGAAPKARQPEYRKTYTWGDHQAARTYKSRVALRTSGAKIGSQPHEGACFSDADTAEAAGAWLRLAVASRNGCADYPKRLCDTDIVKGTLGTKVLETITNTLGGALVPEEFQAELVSLKELRGAWRQYCRVRPMASDTLVLPRRTAGATVYFPGEGGAITASNPTFDNFKLTAQKMAVLCYASREILNDSAVSIADVLGEEIAYAFSDKEDEIISNGDGTSTYGTLQGVRHRFVNLSSTRADIAGLQVGDGDLFSELILADFEGVIGRAPAYTDPAGPQWIMNKRMYWNAVVRLAIAQGGATGTEWAEWKSGNPMLLGYPVRFVQTMPHLGITGTTVRDTVTALFGIFNQGMTIGDVRGGMEIATSEHYAFNTDQITWRGIQRFAFNAHDLGNASSTAASQVAGPIVGLLMKAS